MTLGARRSLTDRLILQSIPDPNYIDVLRKQDPRRRICQFTGKLLDQDSDEDGICEIFDSESIDLVGTLSTALSKDVYMVADTSRTPPKWNSGYEDMIRKGLDHRYPNHESYPSNLSAVHARFQMFSQPRKVWQIRSCS